LKNVAYVQHTRMTIY